MNQQNEPANKNDAAWGPSPTEILALVAKREWDNGRNLRDLLLGRRLFPLRYPFKQPTGRQVAANLARLEQFVTSWTQFPYQEYLEWGESSFRQLAISRMPKALVIPSFSALVMLLGPEAQARSKHWDVVITPILSVQRKLYTTLTAHLTTLDHMTPNDGVRLASAIQQLNRNMGQNRYLRALPITGLDTKFIEMHLTIITDLMNDLTGGEVLEVGGLLPWLGCIPQPNNWLTVMPLCEKLQQSMGGFKVLQLPAETVKNQGLPGKALLVVENAQSGFALPAIENTLAVIGCGKNLSWMQNDWLQGREVGYWGDIDSWGLVMLNQARSYCPSLTALMMDKATIEQHLDKMVTEQRSDHSAIEYLFPDESVLYKALLAGCYPGNRLEQEFLDQDFIQSRLHLWTTQPFRQRH